MLKTTCVAYKLDVITCWKDFVSQTGVLLRGMRHVHYLKFCERRDMGSDILDNVSEIEELKGKQYEKHPEDIFLITKRWLADTEMARVVCVMPAGVARDIRLGYHLPTGEADRRVISEGLKKTFSDMQQKGSDRARSVQNQQVICCTGFVEHCPNIPNLQLILFWITALLQLRNENRLDQVRGTHLSEERFLMLVLFRRIRI